jgi:eukaryotic-like serine/threonine-protein kinase
MTLPAWDLARWSRVKALFEESLEMDTEPRLAMLGELQRLEPEIALAVAKMLEADVAFKTSTPESAMSIMASATDPVHAAGTPLGAYVVESCLGAGGMGRVYRARRHTGDVAQTVAIKCLRFPDGDSEFTRRFLRERQILASLNHPHIARFLDTGTDANGKPFVAIEYIDGMTITEFARAHKLSLRDRLVLLIKVMSAVAYLHRQLIVHRDIKPGNVLVDASAAPYLLDFGIAKPLASASMGIANAGETAAENRIFSLTHAAPEQLRGNTVGTATDIYALGALAYELLCDQPPLSLAGLSYVEAEHEILERFPAPLSERMEKHGAAPDASDARAWGRALLGDLDNIVLHALKKEPNERYATVDAFSEDLRRYLDNEPISLRSGQRFYRAQRFGRRHRVAVLLATALVVALSVGSVALWRQNLATQLERDAALVERRKAEALNSILLGAFEAADPSRNRGIDMSARDVLDQATRRIAAPDVDEALRLSLLTTVADVYRTLGLPSEGMSVLQAAIGQYKDVPALTRAKAWRVLAEARLSAGNIESAESALVTAKAAPIRGDGRESIVEAIEQERVTNKIMVSRGWASRALDQHRELYLRALRELGASDPLAIRCGEAYAAQLRSLKRPQESAALVEELLAQMPNPEQYPTGVRLLGDRARYERDLRQIEDAAVHAQQHARGVRLLYGERHPSYISALDLLAKIERDKGNHDAAIALYGQMLGVLDQISATHDSSTRATVLNNLANTLRIAGRADQAADTAQQSVRMAVAILPSGHNVIAHFRITLAEALIDIGDSTGALLQLDQSEAIFSALHNPNSPGIARANGQVLRAEVLLHLERKSEAGAAFARGWQKLSALDPSDPIFIRAVNVGTKLKDAGQNVTVLPAASSSLVK